MSQEAMLDSLEQELKETEFNGEHVLGYLTFIFFRNNLLADCLIY